MASSRSIQGSGVIMALFDPRGPAAVLWRMLLFAVGGLLLYAFEVQSQPRAFTLAIGTIDATDTERTECYFNIGTARAFVMVTHPENTACSRLRELVGTTGTVVFVAD